MDAATLLTALRDGADLPAAADLSAPALWLTPNSAGNTALHVAARHGRLKIVPPDLFTPENFSLKNHADRKSVV